MKITLWQQFSSNHSASFQIVGKFGSVELAQQAAETLQAMLRLIIEARKDDESEDPTPPEIEFAEKYQVTWAESLDWVFNEKAHVIQFDQHVFCGNVFSDTWLGASPIDEIMRKLGGETAVTVEGSGIKLTVELTCTAPNLDKANSILEECNRYLELMRRRAFSQATPPWRDFAMPLYLMPQLQFWYDDLFWGYVEKSDQKLTMRKMNFYKLGYGLPALLKYLTAKGCQNIEYHIEERDYDDVYESEPPN